MRVHISALIACSLTLASCTCIQPDVPDAHRDAFDPPDAVTVMPRQVWLNPSPPACARREALPRWRVTADPGPVGSVRWVRSLGEADFANWLRGLGFRPPAYRRIAPALTGDGVASWIFVAERDDENRMIGLTYDAGAWATATPTDSANYTRMWLPDVYVAGLGLGGRSMFPPTPPEYYIGTPPPENSAWLMDPSFMFGPEVSFGGAQRGEDFPMPAWSPTTGEMVSFGARPGGSDPGVGVGCAEGNRWFTQIPGFDPPTAVNFVRPNGDVIVTSGNDVWVLNGATGEPLREAILGDAFANSATYHPACGVLVELPTETTTSWYWLNDETMEPGPALRLPVDRSTSIGAWSGTPDCGLVASAGTGNMVRLNADGTVRYNVPIPAGVGITIASPPVALEDGGTLLMVDPPGWMRLNAAGEITSTVRLDAMRVGARSAGPTTLAPDGTMYFMTRTGTEIRFGAASTGAIPGPYLWRQSGLNWARTNSILPD